MKGSFLAYFGHVNIDVLMKVPSFPRSGSVGVDSISEVYGGTAGNFGFVSSKLGLRFDIYSSVSSRTHLQYLEKLKQDGISTSHITIDDERMGPICYLVSDSSEQIGYIYQGPMDHWKPSVNFGEQEYDYVHFSTGPPKEYIKVAKKVKGKSRIVFDPSQEISFKYDGDELRTMLDLADIFMGNVREVELMQKMSGFSIDDLLAEGKSVIATNGSKGSMLYYRDQKVGVLPYLAGTPKDTTGAGDAFRAGFYFGLSKGLKIREAMAVGSVVSAESIVHGIGNFTPDSSRMLAESRKLVT